MWHAVTQISTGLALAAFFAAVGFYAFKHWLGRREKLIRAAGRANQQAVMNADSAHFPVATDDLPSNDKTTIILEQIRARQRRTTIGFGIAAIAAVIAGIVALTAIVHGSSVSPAPSAALSASLTFIHDAYSAKIEFFNKGGQAMLIETVRAQIEIGDNRTGWYSSGLESFSLPGQSSKSVEVSFPKLEDSFHWHWSRVKPPKPSNYKVVFEVNARDLEGNFYEAKLPATLYVHSADDGSPGMRHWTPMAVDFHRFD
jgi:hypothetical protein